MLVEAEAEVARLLRIGDSVVGRPMWRKADARFVRARIRVRLVVRITRSVCEASKPIEGHLSSYLCRERVGD